MDSLGISEVEAGGVRGTVRPGRQILPPGRKGEHKVRIRGFLAVGMRWIATLRSMSKMTVAGNGSTAVEEPFISNARWKIIRDPKDSRGNSLSAVFRREARGGMRVADRATLESDDIVVGSHFNLPKPNAPELRYLASSGLGAQRQ